MEGNRIVLVWGCAENGRKWNCVGLGMYREWKEIELCWFGDVQRVEKVKHSRYRPDWPRGWIQV
jgi:hypothetical protein